MAAAINREGFSPLTKMKIIPQYKSYADFPQQRLRHGGNDAPRFDPDDEDQDVDADEIELLLSSLRGFEDDYGSYAPIVTPVNANTSETNSSETSKLVSNRMAMDISLESEVSFESVELEVGNGPRAVNVRPSDFFKMGPSKVSNIVKSLAKRIEIGSGSGRSTTVYPMSKIVTPRNGSSFNESPSCTSEAETEVWDNLTSRFVGTEVSSLDGDTTEMEVWNSLASTFVGREQSLVGDGNNGSTNSLCENDKHGSAASGPKIQPKIFINTESEIELLYPTVVTMKEYPVIDTNINMSSEAESSLSASSRSCTSSDETNSSNSSNSSRGILRPPKRAIGYDPFGKYSDFSLPGTTGALAPRPPQRRVHFWNTDKLNHNDNGVSALDCLMKAQASGKLSADAPDDDSTASLEYMMEWCGVPLPEDLEDV